MTAITPGRHRRDCLALVAALAALPLLATPAAAQDASIVTLGLDAGHARLELRAYAMGVLPLDGRFETFAGTLAITPPGPGRPAQCHVALTVTVASLQMEDAAVGRDMLGPALLDAARYPIMRFAGTCTAQGVAGLLDLHGVSAPLTLAVRRRGDLYIGEAQLHRADWGVTGRPALAGQTVRIRLEMRLPPGLMPEEPAG